MTYKTSSGLRNYMQVTGSARAALAGGKIRIFSGPEPVSADAAETGTLLCVIDKDGAGAGFTLDTTAVDGIVSKVVSDVLKGTIIATGIAGYYRYVGAADTGVVSTTEPRVQGRVSKSGAEMNLGSTAFESGIEQPLYEFSINLPTF
ncbi:hypothetical protein [Acidovorax radicis]|uniref:hypothetical protein n=1 Tax=Acidovorax radicis TaxID=758826 RepID=UPI001CF95EA3|nr:hypothetical protein [Acidovorax radicis]UCV01141.1 hypothetical protein KI609_10710 [Acidovorax radicis]